MSLGGLYLEGLIFGILTVFSYFLFTESKSKLAKVASSPSLRPRAGSAKTTTVRSRPLV